MASDAPRPQMNGSEKAGAGRGRFWFALIVGAGGLGVLLLLGVWQATKYVAVSAQMAELEAQMAAAPIELTAAGFPDDPVYRRVAATGRFVDAAPLRMPITHARQGGDIYIYPFEVAGGERILAQVGFAPEGWSDRIALPEGEVRVVGVIDDPREVGAFTPEPDFAAGIVFARDVPTLAAHFDAAPLLLVLDAAPTGESRYPLPIPVVASPPVNHLGYAITWFSIAAIWAAMTALLLWGGGRSRRRERAS